MNKIEGYDYSQIVGIVLAWLRYAGPEARKAFEKEIKERDYDRRTIVNDRLRDCYIVNRAMDYSESMYSCGGKFVYLFVDEQGEIYYVGKGNELRFQRWQGRNEEFQQHYKKSKSKVVLVAKFCTEEIARDVEKLIIWQCQLEGFRLKNNGNMLSRRELYEIRNIPNDSEKDTNAQRKYRLLAEEYKDALLCFKEIEKWLYDGGMVQSPDCVNEK